MLLGLEQREREQENKSLNWTCSFIPGCREDWRAWMRCALAGSPGTGGTTQSRGKAKDQTMIGMGRNVAALKRVYLIEGEAK